MRCEAGGGERPGGGGLSRAVQHSVDTPIPLPLGPTPLALAISAGPARGSLVRSGPLSQSGSTPAGSFVRGLRPLALVLLVIVVFVAFVAFVVSVVALRPLSATLVPCEAQCEVVMLLKDAPSPTPGA